MRKWKYYVAAGILLIPVVALAADTAPYISGTGGITAGNLLAAGATVGQIVDGGAPANRIHDLSWSSAQDLSAHAIPVVGFIGVGATVVGISCRPEVVVGGTATIAVWKAPSGTALASGTKLNTTDCNANTGATTTQTMGVASSTITAGDWIGIVATGAGWASSVGSGAIQISIAP